MRHAHPTRAGHAPRPRWRRGAWRRFCLCWSPRRSSTPAPGVEPASCWVHLRRGVLGGCARLARRWDFPVAPRRVGRRHARAGPLDSRAAAEGHREWAANRTRAPRPFVRGRRPADEAIRRDPRCCPTRARSCPAPPNEFPTSSSSRWCRRSGSGPTAMDCDAGGFANLGLTPDTRGAGELLLGSRSSRSHAHRRRSPSRTPPVRSRTRRTAGTREKDVVPCQRREPSGAPLERGAPALARHARAATESSERRRAGGYY